MLGKIKKLISISLYWKCQLIGWGVVSLLWLYIALVRDQFNVFHALINYVLDVAICIGLTHLYRYYALRGKWNELNIKKLLIKAIPLVLLLSVAFMQIMMLKTSFFVYMVFNRDVFLENVLVWNPVLLTGLRQISIWVLAYHLYHFYKKEIHTAKANAQLSIIAKQAQLDNLSAQLNPHFLFNSLNSIKSLVMENPKTARRAVDLLSDLLRSSLYEKDRDLLPIKEELLLVKDYIELEKMRFEERLNVIFDIDESLENFMIPTLSIQLLVENAIKHGVDKYVEGGLVEISIKETVNFIEIIVKNPGKLNYEKKNGLGLSNLKKRLEIQYKGKASIKISEASGKKIVATLLIPIVTE
ncbi:sensor histidine kinase [Pontimicrobium aquaticum]|uniref:Sensor histidine kinase n=1 Tax=Pontimicrobium aquaticum TaxID=2565367 RepID=A0A4U0F0U2_9FLAO|nr:histidine kinase [Pontimicrobium aquaticum]TJY38017.1 sensor histidine kinase [Pontimicrobium aquaticum]